MFFRYSKSCNQRAPKKDIAQIHLVQILLSKTASTEISSKKPNTFVSNQTHKNLYWDLIGSCYFLQSLNPTSKFKGVLKFQRHQIADRLIVIFRSLLSSILLFGWIKTAMMSLHAIVSYKDDRIKITALSSVFPFLPYPEVLEHISSKDGDLLSLGIIYLRLYD